jgi:thioredoxin-like negative regulator of GroEL
VEEAAYLKALFHSGQMAPFASRWERLKGRPFIAHDLELYHDAYLAGWGPSSTVGEGQRRLEAELANPEQAILANRLQLFVCARLNDADRYLASLRRLEQAQSDTLLEHMVYWQLLAALGHQEEARTLLHSYARPPASAAEALRLAEIQVALGLRAEAQQFLEHCTAQFGNAQDIWLRRAALLQEDQRWEDLREMALQLRQNVRMRDALAGYSYYLEGCAELGLDRPAVADTVFRKVAQYPVENRALALSTARSLLKLGYAAVARDLLLPLAKDFGERADYWHELLGAAYQLKEPDLMAKAAAAGYRLQPGNVACANNYAATLLVNRDRPDEAVSLTLQILSRFPDSNAAKINHALALLLNRRTAEAEAILKSIVPEKLSGQEANSFYLGRFEVSFNQQQYDQAWEASDRIAAKHLFPNQLKWLEEVRQQLPRRTAAN